MLYPSEQLNQWDIPGRERLKMETVLQRYLYNWDLTAGAMPLTPHPRNSYSWLLRVFNLQLTFK